MTRGAPRGTGRADVLIAGGGTAGHVIPALNVAKALVASGRDMASIHFVGSRRGMEKTFIPEAGFAVTLLPGRGIVRKPSMRNIGAIVGLLAACVMSLWVVVRLRPKVVVSVGGYASIPPAMAAFILRVPIVVVTIDAVPGAANRLVGRFATANAVAYPMTALPHATVTGAPVRSEVTELDLSLRARAKRRSERSIGENAFFIVLTGGSLGARRLNDAGMGIARDFSDRDDVVIQHVTGARDVDRVRDVLATIDRGKLDYRVSPYEDRLYELMSCADVVVSRAGASTVAELGVIGAPSILVPLPNAPGDHQRINAEVLAHAGAALIVNDDVIEEQLSQIIEQLHNDRSRLWAMSEAASHVGVRDGSLRIAELIGVVAEHISDRSAIKTTKEGNFGE